MVQSGGRFNGFISSSVCSDDCGLQLISIANAICQGETNLVLYQNNANSYDVQIYNRSGSSIYSGAGLINGNGLISIWDGSGATYEAVYVAYVTLRNNCGEKIFKMQDVLVWYGGCSKNTKSDFIDTSNLVYVENENIMNLDIFSDIITDKDFVVFPNPSNGLINIETKSDNLPYVFHIINSIGQIIYTSNSIKTKSACINLPKEIKGYYTVEIISNHKKFYNKILIQ